MENDVNRTLGNTITLRLRALLMGKTLRSYLPFFTIFIGALLLLIIIIIIHLCFDHVASLLFIFLFSMRIENERLENLFSFRIAVSLKIC